MHRPTRRARLKSKARRLAPLFDNLETRALLSTAAPVVTVHPLFEVGPMAASTSPPAGAYTPAQIAQAYGFNQITFGSVQGTGAGQTIAIVDAYDDPNIQSDLNTFDTQFGLPSTTVTRVNETGGTSLPSTDSTGGWELEESLDVEWAHAVAPGAKIVLVEASSANSNDLLSAVSYAGKNANVVSMSWGGSEFSGENSYDNYFSQPGVTFVAASGDTGAPAAWPATSPYVVGVGGTALTTSSNGTWSSETGWSGSTGGPSTYESQPAYQHGVVTQTTTQRATPDVAYDASPSTGFAVYDSFQYSGVVYGWMTVGGTSAGAPQWSALLAIADQGRALSGQQPLNATNPEAVLTTLYQNATTGDFHDVTSGTSTGSTRYSAGPGYDYVTGLGSPLANRVVQSLDGNATSTPSDTLSISASASSVTAGSTFSITVTADKSGGGVDSAYAGTVVFSSGGNMTGLPASYTFTSTDGGTHTFTNVALDKSGNQSITVQDSASGNSATTSTISVNPGAVSKLVLSGAPSSALAGTPVSITVTAEDQYGNVVSGDTGTATLSSSDTAAILSPASQSLANGTATFAVTFETAGVQSITVSGTAGPSVSQTGITVGLPAPTGLAASAVSTTEIDLSWNAATGATGYTVQSSPNGTSWTTLGTTAAGITTYKDTGLAAGTTDYFRVAATASGTSSAYSATASATTTGGSVGGSGGDTLWANTYTPSENAYSSGAYDLGVKFTSSVSGTVTGVRFYKQTWMSGYTHVGYLWSSTGTLLASATFTNESSSGWEQVSFSKPVSIAANTEYIVSFSSGGGYFGVTTGYFSTSGYQNGPLNAPASGAVGGNGVYGAGTGAFPSVNAGGMNFWVDLDFSPSSVTTSASDTFVVSAPSTATAGTAVNVTVTAINASGNPDTSYNGTVVFSSNDSQASLPTGSVTLTNGTGTFAVTLKSAGNRSVTVTDTTSGNSATTSGITVSAAAASHLVLTGLPTTATAGSPVSVTVTAVDTYGNVATGYAGTVSFASSDVQSLLPGSYGFTSSNAGAHTFSVTFETAGSQSVTVSDGGGLTISQSAISVVPATPTGLAATAASSSEIDLSWSASAGATGYTVQSLVGGVWTTIGTTAAGVTTYKDTSLTAGTTYSFRVYATGVSSGLASGDSNTASATTTGGSVGGSTTDTLWANTYTPSENSYASGAYDLGVKFTSSVSGTVTGVRFYKQTWMSGYTHVGYLWSSTGTLLASATFTNESSYGWEQVSFSNPVSITANSEYIVSFSSGGGYFGVTTGYFSTSGYQNGPLDAPASGAVGGNGVYGVGTSAFPTVNGNGMNFWVDVVFSPSTSGATSKGAAVASTSRTDVKGSSYVVVMPPDSPSKPSVVSVGVSGGTASPQYSTGLGQKLPGA